MQSHSEHFRKMSMFNAHPSVDASPRMITSPLAMGAKRHPSDTLLETHGGKSLSMCSIFPSKEDESSNRNSLPPARPVRKQSRRSIFHAVEADNTPPRAVAASRSFYDDVAQISISSSSHHSHHSSHRNNHNQHPQDYDYEPQKSRPLRAIIHQSPSCSSDGGRPKCSTGSPSCVVDFAAVAKDQQAKYPRPDEIVSIETDHETRVQESSCCSGLNSHSYDSQDQKPDYQQQKPKLSDDFRRETAVLDIASKVELEIGPGMAVLLRGAHETYASVYNDTFVLSSCSICQVDLGCTPDAEYVLCPLCRTVNPILTDTGNGNNNEDSNKEGVGLGFTMEELCRWQTELHNRRSAAAASR